MSKHVIFKRFSHTALAIALCSCYSMAFAQESKKNSNEIKAQETNQTLETIEVQAMLPDEINYAARQANSLLKTDAPLFETPRSVSVITQELIQQKQATSVGEALDGVAGVSANPYGRRGFDDFVIRGQVASDNIFVDGLRLTSSIFSSVELAGTDTVQVLKGPAAVEFGAGSPGGAVNLTTKRPQTQTFYRGGISYGSFQDISGTFDINYAPNDTDKGAFRIVGRAGDKNDPVDYVYFKNYYVSPSYNFDLGDRTDLSVVASYQYREFVRQQGLPKYGTLEYNPNATYDESRFASEPDTAYKYDVYRVGYNFAHEFANGLKFKQNFATNRIEMDADVVLVQGTAMNMFSDRTTNAVTLRRNFNTQDRTVTNYALDNSLNKTFDFSNVQHNVSVGVDGYFENNIYDRTVRSLASLNLNNPVYGSQPGAVTGDTTTDTDTRYIGVYVKDHIKINDKFIIGLSGRHDWTTVKTNIFNNRTNATTSNSEKKDSAFTGSASVMYKWNDVLAPYASYATSFNPVTDTDINGNILDPEHGQQYEAGVKFQAFNGNLQGALSAYELTRKNVPVASLTDSDYSESTGKQVTRGIELEVAADIANQWNIAFAYSHIPYAKIVEDKEPRRVGLRIDHVPRNSANLMTRYYFDPSQRGWYVGGGVRYEGVHVSQRPNATVANSTYARLPAYTLYDAQMGYKAQHWGANFSVKNIFDEHYYAGTTPNSALIATGLPRTFNFGLTFDF